MISEKKLEQFGLSDKEAKVYRSLLELGQAAAAEIAIKSGIKRATTYVMLETLLSKGMISTVEKDKKTLFIVEEPYSLLKNLYSQKDDLDEQIELAKKVIPELQIVYNLSHEKSKVRMFEGREGMKFLSQDVLKSKVKHFDNISNINLALQKFPPGTPEGAHRKDFLNKNWTARVIFTYDPKLPIPILPKIIREDRRYLPQDKYPFYSDIVIYGNKVSMITLKKTIVGVIVENEEIAQTLRSWFELAWEATEKYKEK